MEYKDIKWHFIGHLQRNKADKVINEIDCLHSLDSFELAKLINEERKESIDCFIQVNLTKESSKYGVNIENLDSFIETIKKYDKINVVGLMAMGKQDDPVKTEEVFASLSDLKTKYGLKYLSMGMSDDYLIAIKHNATHLRIGSLFKGVI
ncbi:YggS family pyridoxal phosphate-dependent enzyme [Acholeplasma sp. OttesenSCG-928-E16]|nr:YggS family pyridoxal phosphate-dependent enzyme [Acholeplasma sp. OttesenSCG-928-E16]